MPIIWCSHLLVSVFLLLYCLKGFTFHKAAKIIALSCIYGADLLHLANLLPIAVVFVPIMFLWKAAYIYSGWNFFFVSPPLDTTSTNSPAQSSATSSQLEAPYGSPAKESMLSTEVASSPIGSSRKTAQEHLGDALGIPPRRLGRGVFSVCSLESGCALGMHRVHGCVVAPRTPFGGCAFSP